MVSWLSLSIALTVYSSGPSDLNDMEIRRDTSEQTRTGMTGMWTVHRLLHVTTQDKLDGRGTRGWKASIETTE